MREPEPATDTVEADVHFSKFCFNRASALMTLEARTAAEDEEMCLASAASLWHWMRRPDCTDRNLSIGYWQASRVHALLGRADEAMRLAERCLDHSRALSPFYLGYAYEALARAARLGGDAAGFETQVARAREWAAQVEDDEERRMLLDDLAAFGADA